MSEDTPLLLVEKLLKYVSIDHLNDLIVETKADEGIRKLDAKTIFSLLLYSLLESDKVSLRSMTEIFERVEFQVLIGNKNKGSTGKSSLSDRLSSIPQEFFEKSFYSLVAAYERQTLGQERTLKNKKVIIFDSTFLTFGRKLLQNNFTVTNGDKKQVKLTIGYSVIPKSLQIHHDKSQRSEDISLKEALLKYKNIEDEIAVFDRGLQSRRTFVELDQKSVEFVTRLNDKAVYEEKACLNDVTGKRCGNLTLQKDVIVYLHNFREGKIPHEFRLIQAINDQGKVLKFLSNMVDLSTDEIISIYKYRWQIELFFKAIKQNLKAKHLISYSQNGIAVFIYMILIASMMISIYQIQHSLKYWVEAKRKLVYELKVWLTRDILILFDGNLQKFDEYIAAGGRI